MTTNAHPKTNHSTIVNVHVLQTFPFACVNRDDSGMPKTTPFGGDLRSRWSSQSQKYNLRHAFHTTVDPTHLCTKTRRLPIMAVNELVNRGHNDTDAAAHVIAALLAVGINLNSTEDAKKDKLNNDPDTDDTLDEDVPAFGKALTGRTQVILPVPHNAPTILADAIEKHWDTLTGVIDLNKIKNGAAKDNKVPAAITKAVTADVKKAIDADRLIDVALFGRMLTEIPDQTVTATSSVAHAFTTNPEDAVTEFWSAVDDDAANQGHGGSANMGTQGFASGCFYRYASLDVTSLTNDSPLTGDPALIRAAVEAFIRHFIDLKPTAMAHGTAPYTEPVYVAVSISDRATNLANAFTNAVTSDYNNTSARRLADAWNTIAVRFPRPETVYTLSGLPDTDNVTINGAHTLTSLDDLVAQATEETFRG